MKMKDLGFCVLGMICVMDFSQKVASADVPLSFDTIARVSLEVDLGSTSDSGVNYASCEFEGELHGWDRYEGESSISCSTAPGIPDVATIQMDGRGHKIHEGTMIGTFEVNGVLLIGTTPSIPTGTPVKLYVSSSLENMFDHHPEFGDHFQLSNGSSFLYDEYDPPVEQTVFYVAAGDEISISLFSYFNSTSYPFAIYEGEATLNFSAEVIPEPATALLLLAGLPLIRRR